MMWCVRLFGSARSLFCRRGLPVKIRGRLRNVGLFVIGGFAVCLWPDLALSQSLKRSSDYSKSENRRILEEVIEQAQEALRTLDDPDSASGTRERRNRRERGQPRIVNGRGTLAYPAAGALLKGSDRRSATAWCSGTLIGPDRFLTAAHCVAKDPVAAKYIVFFHSAGFFDVTNIEWQKEEYKFPKADLAILTLASPVPRIIPDAINRVDTPLEGTLGTIVGFGRTGGFNEDYGIKREGFIETARCPAQMGGIPLVCWDFAAEVQNGAQRSNTCNADSGGPLFVYDTIGGRLVRVIAGITSGGQEGDCLLGDHSYDADVYHYKTWVQSTAALAATPQVSGTGPVVDTERDVEGESAQLSERRTEVAFSFEVREGIETLLVAMNGDDNGRGRNNFDLYVVEGSGELSRAACTEDGPGQFGFCRIDSPVVGPWKAVVVRKSGRGLVQVVVTQLPKAIP
jgi:hypothetical protein